MGCGGLTVGILPFPTSGAGVESAGTGPTGEVGPTGVICCEGTVCTVVAEVLTVWWVPFELNGDDEVVVVVVWTDA